MPKDTKTLGNNKARACESLGFAHKKGCANILTQPHLSKCHIINQEIRNRRSYYIRKIRVWFKKKVPASDA